MSYSSGSESKILFLILVPKMNFIIGFFELFAIHMLMLNLDTEHCITWCLMEGHNFNWSYLGRMIYNIQAIGKLGLPCVHALKSIIIIIIYEVIEVL